MCRKVWDRSLYLVLFRIFNFNKRSRAADARLNLKGRWSIDTDGDPGCIGVFIKYGPLQDCRQGAIVYTRKFESPMNLLCLSDRFIENTGSVILNSKTSVSEAEARKVLNTWMILKLKCGIIN